MTRGASSTTREVRRSTPTTLHFRTPNGRVKAEYVLPPEDEIGNTPFRRYYENEDWDASSATLHYDEQADTFSLHVTLKNPEYKVDGTERQEAASSDDHTQNGVVLGVDLNVDGAFAYTSTGQKIGSADKLDHKRNEYERIRGNLQQTDTRSSHLTIKQLGGRFSNWSKDWLYRKANELIKEAQNHTLPIKGIIFEELTHIRENIAKGKKFQQWMFKKFIDIVEYKVEDTEPFVDYVSPAHTSRRCSKCGFTHEDNRDGDKFECLDCSYENHADYNARQKHS